MAVLILDDGLDCIVGQALGVPRVMDETDKASSLGVEAVGAVVLSRHPNETVAVLEQAKDIVVRQRVGVVGIVLIVAEGILGYVVARQTALGDLPRGYGWPGSRPSKRRAERGPDLEENRWPYL